LLSSSIIQFLPFVDEKCQFFNLYGPAEITIVATCHEVRREELSTIVSLPIGYPLVGYRIYLLDEYRQSVVPGQTGEIIIGGEASTFYSEQKIISIVSDMYRCWCVCGLLWAS
jgi:non-ribosomal peptide synthetase component F